jgi:hypothetical protein
LQLADLANLTQPWAIRHGSLPTSGDAAKFSLMRAFKDAPATVAPPIAFAELEAAYCSALGIPAPIPEMPFAASWMLFRVRALPFCLA